MKKTLIALAAVAATGAAFAQSSVTLYGVADVAIGDNNAAGTKLGAIANGTMNNGNSRFGLRGTEDLGGGLKAGFKMEAAVNLANGATDAKMFQRAATISLSGGFGEVVAGRGLTPAYYSKAAYELTGYTNYSALFTQFGFSTAGGAGTEGARKDALVTYTTPNMGGFTATIGTVLEGNNAKKPMEFAATYRAGPLVVSGQVDTASNSAGVKRGASVGASYDLGVAKIAGSIQDPAGPKKGFTLGASAPMGPVTLTANLARATNTADKATDYVLEAKYALSKRTFVYGAYLNNATQGAATVKSWGLGVRHNF